MKDSTTVQKNNQEWLTNKQVAEAFGISKQRANALLKKYQFHLANYIRSTTTKNKKTSLMITKEGLVVLATMKNIYYATEQNGMATVPLAKQQLAEKAIEAVTPDDDDMIRDLQERIEMRRRQLSQEKKLNEVDSRLQVIENDRTAFQQKLFELPAPKVAAPARTERSLIRECVNQYVRGNNGTSADYARAWEKLFTECNYRLNMNLAKRAKDGKDRLTILEEEGALTQVYAIACEIFRK